MMQEVKNQITMLIILISLIIITFVTITLVQGIYRVITAKV